MNDYKKIRELRDERIPHISMQHTCGTTPCSAGNKEDCLEEIIVNLPPTLQDVLRLIQINNQSDKKDCVNYHTNKYQMLSLYLDDIGAGVGYVDIDLTKEISEQEPETLSKLLELIQG